jgi:tRNA pseudouridine55 synthase
VKGVLIIDKPAGLTSHDVVARVRRTLGEKRVGHTGTLDPFATGVLVVLVGRATRLAQFLSGAEKEYEAVIRLGYATETGDLTGERLDRLTTETQRAQRFHREELETALASLRGEIEQVPPMYSAKKHEGRRLYELARRGEEIERAAVRVTIHEFEPVNLDGPKLIQNDDGTYDLAVRVVCSTGTYVRTLAEDFGKRLGVGAHLAALRRTRAGDFRINDAITLDELQEKIETSAPTSFLSPDAALSRLPYHNLDADETRRTLNGMDVQVSVEAGSQWRADEPVRMRDETGNLVAIGFYDEVAHTLHPRVVVATPGS